MDSSSIVQIKIDLAGILGHAAREVRRVVHLTSVALAAPRPSGLATLQDRTSFSYAFDPPPTEEDVARLNSEYESWILIAAFRDLAELISAVLAEAQMVRSYWRFFGPEAHGKPVLLADLNRDIAEELNGFNRLTLPDKLAALKADGVWLDEAIVGPMLSINATRNCLVHRLGFVGDRDADASGALVLQWFRVVLKSRMPSGDLREIHPPYTTREGEELLIEHGPTTHEFTKGQRIELSAQTFADIGWTVTLFAQNVAAALEQCGRRIGIAIGPPSPSQ